MAGLFVFSLIFFRFWRLVVAETKENGSANKGVFFADFALQKAFPRPVEKLEVAAVNHEPRRTGVGLDDVFGLGASVFEAGGNMFDNGLGEDFIEFGSFDFLVASGVNLGGKFKKFGDVVTGGGTGDKDGGVGQEIEIAFEFVKNMVGVVDEIGLSEDNNDAFAGVDDLAGEGLVKFGVGLGGVN